MARQTSLILQLYLLVTMLAMCQGHRVLQQQRNLEDSSREDGGQSKCCCKGKLPESCRDLSVNELVSSRNPLRYGEVVCPVNDNWHNPNFFGIDQVPGNCSAHSDNDAKEIVVKAYWMRHGWSCSNALQAQGKKKVLSKISSWMDRKLAKLNSLKFFSYSDPSLTTAAIERAEVLGWRVREQIMKETNNKQPLVFSSAMVRAIETALYNFPGWEVRPLPFIAETGSMPDNTPQAWEHQETRKLDRPPTSSALLDNIIFDVNPSDHEDRSSGSKSDYHQFRKYFPGILEELLELQDEGVDYGDEVPVIIVSHSGFMREFLDCKSPGDGKPRNNEVWVQKYKVKLGAYDAVLEHIGCEKLIESEYFPLPPTRLCERDVSRCAETGSRMRPNAWLEVDEKQCKQLGNISIVERDSMDHEAYLGRT